VAAKFNHQPRVQGIQAFKRIAPEGFTLLNGGPKYRRAFLDWGCFHNEAGFFNASTGSFVSRFFYP
jgi:recombinational DNA repair ATPase RecF